MFRRTSSVLLACLLIGLGAGLARSQQTTSPPDSGGPPPMEGRRPPMERAFHMGPRGHWWNNPEFAQKLGLNADQQKKMEAVIEQSRPALTDLSATVHKEEAVMEPLLAADQPDEGKILAQIDRLAQARAELEKANARMLLGLRRVLTPEQWKTLQANEPHGRYPHFGQGPGPRNEGGPTP